MFDCSGVLYHLNTYRNKYFAFGIMLVFMILGIVLTVVGKHELNTLMCAVGILILIVDGFCIVGYGGKMICCLDTNCCCDEPNWEPYGDV